MERLSGSGSLPDGDSDQEGGFPIQSAVHVVVFPPFMLKFLLSFFNHFIIGLSVSIFSPSSLLLCFTTLLSLGGGSRRGSVLIRPGKGSGDNGPTADIHHRARPLSQGAQRWAFPDAPADRRRHRRG